MTSHFPGWSLAEAVERTTGSQKPDDEDTRFWTMVECGQLVAYGRRHPQSDREWIPAITCHSLIYRDFKTSGASASNAREKPFLDILIYPVLHSSNTIDFLDGMSLKDVFWQFVLHDPEVQFLGSKAIKADPNVEWVYLHGWCHPPVGREWPVAFAQGGLAGGRAPNSPIGYVANPLPQEVQRAADIVCLRYSALLTLLRRGKLEAVGDPTRSRGTDRISPAIWSHRSYFLDAQNGDVLQTNSADPVDWHDLRVKRWRAVMLRRPQPRSHEISNLTRGKATGRWVVLGELSTGQHAVYSAITEVFPNGIERIRAAERNRKIREYQKTHGDFSQYGDQTIKRCLKKIQFRPKLDRPDPT